MNTLSASRASEDAGASIRIWDAPQRVVHWLLVFCFAGAWLTAESEHWRLIHVTLGYTFAGLVVFRLAWGLVGGRYARFTQFVRAPGAALRYLRSLVSGKPEHHTGHNPAGGLAVVALLGLGALLTFAGWATYNDAGDLFEELHEGAANVMLGLVLVHVAAVIGSSLLHRENLVGAMVHGRKRAERGDAPVKSRAVLGTLVLAAVLSFWWWSYSTAPAAGAGPVAEHHHDDD